MKRGRLIGWAICVPGLLILMASGSLFGRRSRLEAGGPFYCEIERKSYAAPQPPVLREKVWFASPTRYRVEWTFGGPPVINIRDGMDEYEIQMVSKTGVRLVNYYRSFKFNVAGPLGEYDVKEMLRRGGRKIGQETINGVLCDIYRRTEPAYPEYGLQYTIWTLPGPEKRPRRARIVGVRWLKGPMDAYGEKLNDTVDFTNWQVGKPMDAALFHPPKDVKITTILPEKKAKRPSSHTGNP